MKITGCLNTDHFDGWYFENNTITVFYSFTGDDRNWKNYPSVVFEEGDAEVARKLWQDEVKRRTEVAKKGKEGLERETYLKLKAKFEAES